MNYKIPKRDAVLAFLYKKGWKLVERTNRFYILDPPAGMRFSEKMQYFIPDNDQGIGYSRFMDSVLTSISELYRLDRKKLEDMLSPTWEDAVNAPSNENASLADAA